MKYFALIIPILFLALFLYAAVRRVKLYDAFTVYHKNAIEDVFLTHAEPDLSALSLQAAEVSEVRWAGEEDVLSLLRAGQFVIHYEGYLRLLFEKQKEM